MINFIIYESNDSLKRTYKNIIRNFMSNLDYNIYEFNKFNKEMYDKIKNITGKKIYLLDADDVGVSGLDIARSIRNNGDWSSQIIAVTNCERYINFGFTTRLLMVDFISKYGDLKNDLYFSLSVAFSILNAKDMIVFKSNGEIFQFLYSDIYYIEKNLNDNDSTIVTKNGSYIIKSSINKIMSKLGSDPRFFKSHRSCILNLNNILSFDTINNIVKFGEVEINLISRTKRKELEEKLVSNRINL